MLQPLGAVPALFAAGITTTDRRLVARLQASGALTPATAVRLVPAHPLSRWRLARLTAAGAVARCDGDGRVYLHPAGWNAFRRRRRHRVLAALAAFLPLAGAVMWWASRA